MNSSISFVNNYNLKHNQFNEDCIACHAVQRCNKYHYPNSVHDVFQKTVIDIMGARAKSIKEKMCYYYAATELTVEQAVVLKIILKRELHFNIDLEFSWSCLTYGKMEAIFSFDSANEMEISPRWERNPDEEEELFIAF